MHCNNDIRNENVNVSKYNDFDKNLEEQMLCIDRLESLLNSENIELQDGTNRRYEDDNKHYQCTEFRNERVLNERNNNRETNKVQLKDFQDYSLDKIKYYNQSRKDDYLVSCFQ